MRVIRIALVVAAAFALGCGGSSKGYIPVDSQIKPWQPPEIEEPAPTEPAPDQGGTGG